jgi:hypothetical protein
MLQCPYCGEDAETCGHWDSFDDCRFYLGKIAPMVSDLKARIAELEKSDSETIKALSAKVASLSAHETCACSIDTPEDVCMHHSPEVMRLRKRVAEFEVARQWQPIETFYPEKEGAVLLFFTTSNYQAIGYFDGETWQLESGPTDEKPTHWMPLPEAPK